MPFHRSHSISAFTLIELLVVIAIVAILSIVVVLVLNPFQLLAQSRDASRISDMSSLNTAVTLYQADAMATSAYFVGAASTSYPSLPDATLTGNATSTCSSLGLSAVSMPYVYQCASLQGLRDIDGTGWIPVNFNAIIGGSPFGALSADPVNQTSSGLYYSYETNGNNTYAISALMESAKYAKNAASTGGRDPSLYSVGPGITTLPVLGRGLVGYWSLDEGSGGNVVDWSGGGNNGTWAGTPVGTSGHYSPGQIGSWAGAFDGATDGITVPAKAAMNNLPNFTVSVWFKAPASTPNYSMLVVLGAGDAASQFQIMKNSTANNIQYRTSNGGSGYSYAGLKNVFDNNWHQIVLTYNGTSLTSYVDNSVDLSQPLAISIYNGATPLYMGRRWDGYYLSGLIDDVRIYNRVLSAAEMQAIYNAEK